MTPTVLLEQLELLTHGERVKTMIALGSRADAESMAIIGQLEQGNMYERMLALYSCFGSRDSVNVLRALDDPSRLICILATRLAPLVCGEAELLSALQSVSGTTLKLLLTRLRRAGQLAIIDRYLALPATQSDHRFPTLLPFGSAEMVSRFIPQFMSHATLDDWRKMARLHPASVLEQLLLQAYAATERDGLLLARVNDLIPLLVNSNAPQTADLVTALSRTVDVWAIKFEPLLARFPRAVADLLLAGAPKSDSRFGQLSISIRKLSTEQIIAVYSRSQNAYGSNRVFGWNYDRFRKLAPDQRAAVFAACESRFRERGGKLPIEVLAALPEDYRVREARKVVSSSRIGLHNRLAYAKFLPWDEMRTAVGPHLRASETSIRALAVTTLVNAVTFHRARLTAVLTDLQDRRAEQDPVRREVTQALSSLPRGVWRAEHLPLLAAIIRHGLDDVGLSPATLHHYVTLLLNAMPVYHEWAAEQLATVLRERGWHQPSRTSILPPAAELSLARTLVPQLEVWATRNDDQDILAAVTALFVRPAAFALALPVLEQLLWRTQNKEHAEKALALVAERAYGRLGDLIPQLLAEDAGWITFPAITNWLLRHRQDLLTPYLDLKPVAGRWGTGRKPFLLPLSQPFGGGTATQQDRLAGAAIAFIADTTQGTYGITQAIKQLALLPSVSPARIIPLADDPRPVVRTTALFALARLDTSAGIPTLIAALQDARAPVAIHALRSALERMPVAEAIALLKSAPFERVSVAKEVVRLLSKLDAPAAWEQLVTYWRQDLHQDVRIALLRSLDRHLKRSRAWEILHEAAHNPESAVALAALSLPSFAANGLPEQGSQDTKTGVLRLAADLLGHPSREVRDGCREYCQRLCMSDDAHIVTPQLLSDVYTGAAAHATEQQREEAINAIMALFGVCSSADDGAIAAMMRTLLPHRYALSVAIAALGNAIPRFEERGSFQLLRAALAALADDPLITNKRIEMALRYLPQEELAAFLLTLSELPGLDASSLLAVIQGLWDRGLQSSSQELETLEVALSSSNDARIRWLAFTIFKVRKHKDGGWASGWTEAMRARLDVYRNDPAPMVASDAQFAFTDRDTF